MVQSPDDGVKRTKILILTSHTGGGHVSLAHALRDVLESSYEIEIVDPQPSVLSAHYRMLSRYLLEIWSLNYKISDNEKTVLQAHHLYYLFCRKRLSSLLAAVKPDLIITTHPLLTYEIAQVLRFTKTKTPLAILFADPERVHKGWLTEKQADAYLAPTREIYRQALESGIDERRLHLVGWPVRGQFYQVDPAAKTEGLRALGLDPNILTVFLQGGAEGAAKFDRILRASQRHQLPVQFILACGTNEALAARYARVHNVKTLGFTRNIARYMGLADIIAGKAGPNTLFESVALEKPFLATSFIPGQEEGNLKFIERYNLGWVCLQPKQAVSLLESIVRDPALIRAKEHSVKQYKTWNLQTNQQLMLVIEQLARSVRQAA